MSYYKNLVPGQWQIGNIVMGTGTNIRIQSVEINADDLDKQDYQVARTDEMRFGMDQFKPSTIEFTLNVLTNRMLPDYEEFKSNFWHSQPTVRDLKNEWRFDEGRRNWGEMKPLYVCSKLDEIPKVIFGRPGQFKYTSDDSFNRGEIMNVTADYRRADTLAYSAVEFATEIGVEEEPTLLVRSGGDVDTWLRIIGYGPIANPIITIGSQQIKLNATFEEGEAFEISSYPWQRRVVSSNRENLAGNMTGASKYLDKLILPAKTLTPVRWTSDDFNTFIPDIQNTSFQEDIDELTQKTLPDSFTSIEGDVRVRMDILNPDPFSKFISCPVISPKRSSCIYNKDQFNTYNQQSNATITEPRSGRSAITIMSNADMTNFAMLEVTSGVGNYFLKIRTGSGPHTYSSVLAQWENTAALGWHETDIVGIRAEYNESTHHITYKAQFNGVTKATWTDSSDIVSSANRHQGYIFNLDDGVFTVGTGFRNLISYDHGTVPSPTGKMYFFWRDAFSVI